MTERSAERFKSWASPVLLVIIAGLVAVLGTMGTQSLSRIEDSVDGLEKRVRAMEVLTALNTRALEDQRRQTFSRRGGE